MSKVTLNPMTRINRHLSLLGYGDSDIHKTIKKWNNANGSEWTVERLKTLKNHFIHILADQPFDKSWIQYKGRFPKGPFGTLFKLGLKKPKLVLSVLNSYMAYTNPSTAKQRSVIENIKKPMSRETVRFVNQQWDTIRLDREHQFLGEKLFKHLDNPIRVKLSVGTALNTAKPFIKDRSTTDSQWLESLRYTSRRILPTEGLSSLLGVDKGSFTVEPYGGELAILPEKGNKARVIALPHAELQILLKPLHDTISSLLRNIPEDCTYDQTIGANFAKDALKAGKTVHSVDLSAATDRFPLRLQMALLRSLNKSSINWASFFERSAQLKWLTPFGDVTYGAGQPMGLYGSFNLFALTHHAILQTLCRQHNLSHQYRILGDDIIITDDSLATLYKDYMSHIGVEVSPTKTITSNKIAEFAGFVINRKSCMKAAKPLSGAMTKDNMINYIKTLGFNPFKGKLKDLGDLLVYLPEPYGSGLNPRGLSSDARLKFYLSGELSDLDRVLPISSNISDHLLAKAREHDCWNPFLRRFVGKGVDHNRLEDPVLGFMRRLGIEDRSELQSISNGLADARYGREFISNNLDANSPLLDLAFKGSLGRKHRVRPDEYISNDIAWYKKLFGFYPFSESN